MPMFVRCGLFEAVQAEVGGANGVESNDLADSQEVQFGHTANCIVPTEN